MSNQKYSLAARTTSFTGDDNTKITGMRGVKVIADFTVVPTVETTTVTIQMKDPVSGKYFTVLAGAASAAVRTDQLTVFPGAPATANVSANDEISDLYRVIVTHSASGAWTYTISVVELP